MTTPQLDDDVIARRHALAERELALAEIESRLRELWWTPLRMIASALTAGILIVLLGMGFGAILIKACSKACVHETTFGASLSDEVHSAVVPVVPNCQTSTGSSGSRHGIPPPPLSR